MKIVKSVVIDTSYERIWDMLAADRFLYWIPYYKKTRKFEYITEVNTQEDKYKPGTVAVFDVSCHYELVSSIKNKEVKYRFYEKNMLGYFEGFQTFSMEKDDNGILLSQTIESDQPGGLYGKVIYCFTHRWMEKDIMKRLKSLKDILEKTEADED